MQYDPIKKMVGRFFSGPVFMRRIFYFFLDLLLLRTWHVKKALKKIAQEIPGEGILCLMPVQGSVSIPGG